MLEHEGFTLPASSAARAQAISQTAALLERHVRLATLPQKESIKPSVLPAIELVELGRGVRVSEHKVFVAGGLIHGEHGLAVCPPPRTR